VWKVHLENKEPPTPLMIGDKPIATHIVTETPPVAIVDTQEEAKQVMQDLIVQGIRPGDLYAVGFELQAMASDDA
jgi:hypothetical protein